MIYTLNVYISIPNRDFELEEKLESIAKEIENKYPNDECDLAFFKTDEERHHYQIRKYYEEKEL